MSKEVFYPLLLLLIPFIGTLFSSDVNWGVFDFIIMGGLLTLLGVGLKWVSTRTTNSKIRMVYMGLLVLLFLVVWVELAVGVFSSSFLGT
ncbi:MAG: hypothetical protein L7S65_05910 [Schleiferiaceae bacterium]|nr:hypothetical protein [Schleiferiaceae bacterium]